MTIATAAELQVQMGASSYRVSWAARSQGTRRPETTALTTVLTTALTTVAAEVTTSPGAPAGVRPSETRCPAVAMTLPVVRKTGTALLPVGIPHPGQPALAAGTMVPCTWEGGSPVPMCASVTVARLVPHRINHVASGVEPEPSLPMSCLDFGTPVRVRIPVRVMRGAAVRWYRVRLQRSAALSGALLLRPMSQPALAALSMGAVRGIPQQQGRLWSVVHEVLVAPPCHSDRLPLGPGAGPTGPAHDGRGRQEQGPGRALAVSPPPWTPAVRQLSIATASLQSRNREL